MDKPPIVAFVTAVALLAGACNRGMSPTDVDPRSSPSPALDPAAAALAGRPQTVALIASLRSLGLAVEFVELMESRSFPFVSVQSVRVAVEGENVHMFEFGTTTAAEAAAGGISADGSEVGSALVDWISDPHFFRSDRLMVLYVGRSDRILAALARAVGPQFAGRM